VDVREVIRLSQGDVTGNSDALTLRQRSKTVDLTDLDGTDIAERIVEVLGGDILLLNDDASFCIVDHVDVG